MRTKLESAPVNSTACLQILARCALLLATTAALARDPLPRSLPEAQGVSSAGIRAFVEEADRQVDTMHSFMLVRHGHVIAECWWKPESAEKPHVMHSLSKSFTSTAVGLAVADGKLSVDDPVLKFFPEDAPAEPSAKLKAMRVRDLLTMSTGHQTEAKFTAAEPWVKTFLAQPVEHKPGAHFQYNTPATHTLSAIVRKVTGETVLDQHGASECAHEQCIILRGDTTIGRVVRFIERLLDGLGDEPAGRALGEIVRRKSGRPRLGRTVEMNAHQQRMRMPVGDRRAFVE